LANGGFGKRGRNNDGVRRAAEDSKGGGAPQLVSSSTTIDEKRLYVLPPEHRFCSDMIFRCPQVCAANPDMECRKTFTCQYATSGSTVASPFQAEKKRPPGQNRLQPLPISNSHRGKGKGGKGGSSDDFSTNKKHREGRPRSLEEDSFDTGLDLVVKDGDSHDDLPRSLLGNSKGTAKIPALAPVGPQLTSVTVQPNCASTNNQLLPSDYFICSHVEPLPDADCPKSLPQNSKDYNALLKNLPNRCKELVDPDKTAPSPEAAPKASDDINQTNENNPTDPANVLVNDFDPSPGTKLSVTKINGNPIEPTGLTVISLPSGAVLTIDPNGDYIWEPNGQYDSLAPGEEDVDCFTYDITDGDGGSDQAEVCVTIVGKNDPPVAAVCTRCTLLTLTVLFVY
jgi:VCBS repeat-containing protein